MIITLRDKILAQIEDRAAFIRHLIEEYPKLLAEWTDKTDKSFKEIAEEYAEGDFDVYRTTYSSFLSAFNENDYREDMFYKAMVLIVYSYYEGIVGFLARKKKSDDLINQICEANKIEISDNAKATNDYIQSNIRHLRNHLAHNNLNSTKQKEHIERISKEWPEITFSEEDDVKITGSAFILDSLDKEELVLKELCEKLGFKHKRVQTK